MAKVFLSIGAGPGIGLSTARRFASEGFDIVLAARDSGKLSALAEELRSSTASNVQTAVVDCSDGLQVAALVDRYAQELEVLHYNAAAVRAQTLHDQDVPSIIDDINADLTGGLVAARQAASAMLQRGRGTILFTGGILGVAPSSSYFSLSVGKAGLRAAAQALFPDLAAHGVHCAILTIATVVSPKSSSAEAVSAAFWKLHQQPRKDWQWEANYP